MADQGEKVWKKLPGIRAKDKKCQLHLEVGIFFICTGRCQYMRLDLPEIATSAQRQICIAQSVVQADKKQMSLQKEP